MAFPWFSQVLADVGDGQSLQASLSTFSSHVRRVRLMEAAADRSALLLLDEAGMGTDPDEGAALAAATLTALAERAGLVLATTHHSSLKALKYERPDFENAAVQFDEISLAPTCARACAPPRRRGGDGCGHATTVRPRHRSSPR